MIFARGGHARSLVRVDRAGRRTPVTDDRRGFRFPVYSPNGGQIAVTVDPRPSQIWIYDVSRRSGFPLATEGHNLIPLWSRDGARVFYTARRDIYSGLLMVRRRSRDFSKWNIHSTPRPGRVMGSLSCAR